MNTAIIVAAGSGTRFGAEKPKQFLDFFEDATLKQLRKANCVLSRKVGSLGRSIQ